MKNVPVWIDDTPIRKFPKIQKNISVDVLVVGAGVTGITAAYLLKKAGSTVALTERERVASMDTGHTTAHLTYVTDVGLQQLVRNFGKDHAQAAWDAGAAAINEIERIVEEEGIECEFARVPAYVHARVGGSLKKEASSLKKEADLAAKLGFEGAYLNSAAWNYLRENKDYPYYMVKDRLARPAADSVRELRPGDGMIIGRRGKKVAAFRDPNGDIHRLSPVCTHLGCLVRWNPSESTWDCPCHGS